MHYIQSVAAMDLGKHIYIEKPLTHDIWEARALTKLAAEKKLVTQMGNQGQVETVQDGLKLLFKRGS